MVKTALFVIGAATALAACGSTAGTTTTTASVAPATSSSGTIDATVAATPSGNQQLQAAVQAYSAAYLTGKGTAAYALLSSRCQQLVGLPQMISLTSAAASLHRALPVTSFTVNSNSGSQATVTYTYAVAKLNQSQQPWVIEGGSWKDDNC
jgi:hypothetical protein